MELRKTRYIFLPMDKISIQNATPDIHGTRGLSFFLSVIKKEKRKRKKKDTQSSYLFIITDQAVRREFEMQV